MLEKRDTLSRALAAIGTLLVWLPLLAPLIFGLISLMVDGIFRFDYLMPVEFFPLVAVGGVLLVWSALRAHRHQRPISWGLIGAVLALVGSQGLAVITRLAHGETEIGGWEWILVRILLALYSLAVLFIGVKGALLLRDLFRPLRPRSS